jgi:predicted O-linked N-acetylglucosamine transferase (SPINDLY family)
MNHGETITIGWCDNGTTEGKFTEGLYKKMGITEFICNSEEEYVTKAIKYANDDVERKKYERLILDNNYKIIQEKESVDEWKSLLKKLKMKK